MRSSTGPRHGKARPASAVPDARALVLLVAGIGPDALRSSPGVGSRLEAAGLHGLPMLVLLVAVVAALLVYGAQLIGLWSAHRRRFAEWHAGRFARASRSPLLDGRRGIGAFALPSCCSHCRMQFQPPLNLDFTQRPHRDGAGHDARADRGGRRPGRRGHREGARRRARVRAHLRRHAAISTSCSRRTAKVPAPSSSAA